VILGRLYPGRIAESLNNTRVTSSDESPSLSHGRTQMGRWETEQRALVRPGKVSHGLLRRWMIPQTGQQTSSLDPGLGAPDGFVAQLRPWDHNQGRYPNRTV